MFPNDLTLDHKAFEVRNYSSFAALVFLMLEYFSNCHSEYKYIWKLKLHGATGTSAVITDETPARARPTPVKYIYFISRYAALISQIVHYILIHAFLVNAPVKPELCKIWFLFLYGACTITLTSLDAILLLRVYALYRKNMKVYILALPVIIQVAIASFQMEQATRHLKFNSYCDKLTSRTNVALIGGSVVLTHTALLAATFAKRNVAQGHAAVVRLVVREGAWVGFILIGILTATITCAVVTDLANPFAVFIWPTALLSVITCRIILNINKLKIEIPQRGEFDSTEFRLSTLEFNSCSVHNN